MIVQVDGQHGAAAGPFPGYSTPLSDSIVVPVSVFACAILVACTLFNAALAAVNGHVVPIGYFHVGLVQTALTAAALLLVVIERPHGSGPWLAGLWVAICAFVLLSLFRGVVAAKYLSDIATILIFVMLGMTTRSQTLVRALIAVQLVLGAAAIWELLSPQSFAKVFMVRDYYVNTRGFSSDAVWSGPENLYISAERPQGRLIGAGTGFHRGSSLFLEPVSLGNWTVVVTLAIAALRPVLSRWKIALLLAGNLILLFACDGRTALAINLLLLASWPILPLLPRWAPPLFLPLVFLALLFATSTGLLVEAGDTLQGRFRYGIEYLLQLNTRDLLGLSGTGGVVAADSGWAYMIITQSLFGLAAIWLALTLHVSPGTRAERRFVAGMALFLALSLPVSYSTFSIKTAAFLWALYGHLISSRPQAQAREEAPAQVPGLQAS
jgi:putative polymerase